MKEDVPVNYAGGGGGRYGGESGGKEKVWTGRNNSRLMIPGVVRRDGMKAFAVRVAGNEVRGGGIDGG